MASQPCQLQTSGWTRKIQSQSRSQCGLQRKTFPSQKIRIQLQWFTCPTRSLKSPILGFQLHQTLYCLGRIWTCLRIIQLHLFRRNKKNSQRCLIIRNHCSIGRSSGCLFKKILWLRIPSLVGKSLRFPKSHQCRIIIRLWRFTNQIILSQKTLFSILFNRRCYEILSWFLH